MQSLTGFTEQVREFGTASLFAILLVSTIFFGSYLFRAWKETPGRGGRWPRFYTDANRAAIGWLTASGGATLKNGAALFALRAQIEHRAVPSSAIPAAYVAGTLLALWGMICLMHALSRGEWHRSQWGLMIGMALVFGAAFVFG